MQGIQPSSLTAEELWRHAYIQLDARGLPKDWCDALLKKMAELLDELEFYRSELAVQEKLVADLEDELHK